MADEATPTEGISLTGKIRVGPAGFPSGELVATCGGVSQTFVLKKDGPYRFVPVVKDPDAKKKKGAK